MEYDSEIKRLEDFVERLLKGYGQLKAEISGLEQKLQEQEIENEQLKHQMGSMESERGDLGNRVSRLIDRIEAWESELEQDNIEDEMVADPPEDSEADKESSTGESVESEEDDGSGGVQGNLFSASASSK